MNQHLVRFYENDTFLIDTLADYVGHVLSSGDTAVVIATPDHLSFLTQALTARRQLDDAKLRRHYMPLRADRLLAQFMVDGQPDETRFRQVVGNVLQAAMQLQAGRVCVVGETASALSWGADGQSDPRTRRAIAFTLERCFISLQRSIPFSLLCAYPLQSFPHLDDGPDFAAICDLHTGVLPAESDDPDATVPALTRAVASLQQQAYALATEAHQRQEVEQALRDMNVDRLTGLPNRNVFHDRLDMDMRHAQRSGLALALLFIDLDHFKEINDALGHEAGDALLKQVGQRLRAHVRTTDTVTRLGGDEFTVTLTGLHGLDTVTDVANDICRDLARPFRLGGEPAYISASIGITLYPRDAATASELLRNADQAMYQAKEQGRNRFSYFTRSMHEAAQARMAISNELRRALPEQQLRIHYQPIVDLDSGMVRKAEALVRWLHPVRGKISPADFIPIAEHNGQIATIGSWVFRTALGCAQRWRGIVPQLIVHVNVSPAQFFHPDGDNCRHWLSDNDLDQGRHEEIGLEITESLLLGANPAVTKQLLAFQQAGMEIALDDFGTGYSSLSYLRKFNLDCLKIDQSFVYNLEHDAANLALCEAIIVMAHKLGLKVVAEGVESERQYDLLREAGCDFGQGLYFGMPMPPDEFEALLRRTRSGAPPVRAQ